MASTFVFYSLSEQLCTSDWQGMIFLIAARPILLSAQVLKLPNGPTPTYAHGTRALVMRRFNTARILSEAFSCLYFQLLCLLGSLLVLLGTRCHAGCVYKVCRSVICNRNRNANKRKVLPEMFQRPLMTLRHACVACRPQGPPGRTGWYYILHLCPQVYNTRRGLTSSTSSQHSPYAS